VSPDRPAVSTTIDAVEPVVYRPKRIRWVAVIAAVGVVVLFTVLSFGLHGATGTGLGRYQRGDQAAMIGLGVLIALGILAVTRPRVRADAEGIKVRNLVGTYDLPWSVVRAVRFDRNSPWAILELYDNETVAIHALLAADKDYAVEGVRALRALHTAAAGA